jgi:hypothetical protein
MRDSSLWGTQDLTKSDVENLRMLRTLAVLEKHY